MAQSSRAAALRPAANLVANARDSVMKPVHEIRGPRAVGVREEFEKRRESSTVSVWLRNAARQTPSWLVSLLFHMVVMLVLAMTFVSNTVTDGRLGLTIRPNDYEQLDELPEWDDNWLNPPMERLSEVIAGNSGIEAGPYVFPIEEPDYLPISISKTDLGPESMPRDDILTLIDRQAGDGFAQRADRKRSDATDASEAAVALALQWFANHQLPDGSWSFDHTIAPSCQGKCRNPGNLRDARNGATAMALLPFLGAGQTHQTGKYKQNVRAGLYYLISNMKLSNQGGSFHEGGGSMYSHGLAAIALTEAYGMTQDRALLQPAQAVVNFICYAQDPVGGGWRYQPRQAGDTSVVGWQLMALKSAHMSYLQVPPEVIKKAFLFLDSAQAESGATYGYTGPGAGQATTAIGLLCRMYLGWNKENPALQRGVERISNMGVSTNGNMYYNYYATQVARHWEGDVWKKWNSQMHDWLVNSQVKQGHEAGSWHFTGDGHGERGGRHYITSMATMMLEVYYRHMPIYRKVATDDDFAL